MTREEAFNVIDIYCIPTAYPHTEQWEILQKIKEALEVLKQEPCADAISRQAVLDYIDEMPSDLTADGRRMIRRRTLEEYISDTLPPVTPQPKTGHWEWLTEDKYRCSNCYHETRVDECMNKPMYDYCPFCGARMFEPQESEGNE